MLSVVVILPSEKTLPARLNVEIITTLQKKVAPQIFTPRAVYDGRKNLFAARTLPFGDTNMGEVRLLPLNYTCNSAHVLFRPGVV